MFVEAPAIQRLGDTVFGALIALVFNRRSL